MEENFVSTIRFERNRKMEKLNKRKRELASGSSLIIRNPILFNISFRTLLLVFHRNSTPPPGEERISRAFIVPLHSARFRFRL